MSESSEGGDVFRQPLVQMIDPAAGRPRLPLRLMASLLYLKHACKLSDEERVQRWAGNVVWQYFSGMTYYEPRLPRDATQIGRFRTAIGEAGVEGLLKATIDTAVTSRAARPAELGRLIVDTTVQEKEIAHLVDWRLLEIARHKVVSAAKRAGIALKHTFVKEGRTLRRRAAGYAHAKQFDRLRKVVKRQRTILGIVLREVECIGKGKARKPAQAANRRCAACGAVRGRLSHALAAARDRAPQAQEVFYVALREVRPTDSIPRHDPRRGNRRPGAAALHRRLNFAGPATWCRQRQVRQGSVRPGFLPGTGEARFFEGPHVETLTGRAAPLLANAILDII